MDITTTLVAIAAFSAFNERVLEWVLGRWEEPTINKLMPMISVAMGVAEALAFRLNVVPAEWSGVPVLGAQIVTGVALGLGSNVVHLFTDKVVKV